MTDKPESVGNFLHGDAIDSIRTQLALQKRMLGIVRRCLPPFLAEHCQHCVVKKDLLLLYVDSPSWAAQFRFCLPDLRTALEQATGLCFKDIQVRNVVPAESMAVVKPSKYVPPSESVDEVIQGAIEASPHEEIRQALRRLRLGLQRARKTYGEKPE